MRLIITRHGETKENKIGLLQGHLQGRLSDAGKEQAHMVALRLKNKKIDFIYSSDLARASDTAHKIARFHPNAKIVLTKDLRERNIGEYEGKLTSDFKWYSNEFQKLFLNPKKGEDIEALFKRAKNFLNMIIAKHEHKSVLLVAHYAINKALIGVVTDKEPSDFSSIPGQPNTSVNEFEIYAKKGHKVISLACVKHLE